ncbi:extracellular solute-binding protein [Paenibacillus sp. 5J-6]|uniref:Extracellular solute-binding protein n=1 Tax=Paenibacillus silvestris TaxID=2606219 RepID=A0A6L8V907_9BACL|nr:sugar ABC transporter substrate-binding protein [Paenibacillus silvestris]MZQ86101.1 extracellular solute-binding protein [Paenibacillus silvestris]
MVKTSTIVLAGCLASVVALSGCSADKDSAATTSGKSGEKVKLRISSGAAVEEATAEQAAIKAFMDKNPNIEVAYEPIPGDDSNQKLLASVASGNAPDVFLMDSVVLPQFIDNNAVLDMGPYAKKDSTFNKDVWYENVYNIGVRGDKIYDLPRGFTPLVVYYNKEVFDKSGVPYPKEGWTWNDFLETAKKLTKAGADGKTEQYGFTADPYFYKSVPFVWQNGGDVLSKDGKTAKGFLNSPATVEAYQFYTDLVTKHKVSPTPSVKKAFGDLFFQTGKIAMNISGHWTLLGLNDTAKAGKFNINNLGIVGLPKSKENVSVMYEAGWAASASTKHPQEAYQLAKFMAESEVGQKMRIQSGLELSAVKSVSEEYAKDKPLEQAFVKEVQYARQPWGSIHPKWDPIEKEIDKAIEQIIVNNTPVQKAFDDAVPKIDKIINE